MHVKYIIFIYILEYSGKRNRINDKDVMGMNNRNMNRSRLLLITFLNLVMKICKSNKVHKN